MIHSTYSVNPLLCRALLRYKLDYLTVKTKAWLSNKLNIFRCYLHFKRGSYLLKSQNIIPRRYFWAEPFWCSVSLTSISHHTKKNNTKLYSQASQQTSEVCIDKVDGLWCHYSIKFQKAKPLETKHGAVGRSWPPRGTCVLIMMPAPVTLWPCSCYLITLSASFLT